MGAGAAVPVEIEVFGFLVIAVAISAQDGRQCEKPALTNRHVRPQHQVSSHSAPVSLLSYFGRDRNDLTPRLMP